ncbi:MAG: hypothetical protein JHC52_12915 [Chthoniobacterales bacterium]|nr:hypothetical protein [Chthoniobacterales bacterium]
MISAPVMETLAAAAYARGAAQEQLRGQANWKIESVHWLVRIGQDRNLLSAAQFAFSCRSVEECGRMVRGWEKQVAAKAS